MFCNCHITNDGQRVFDYNSENKRSGDEEEIISVLSINNVVSIVKLTE